MRKDQYREFFAECMKYVKMKPILDEERISYSNFYKFVKSEHNDHFMSLEALEQLENAMNVRLNKLIN